MRFAQWMSAPVVRLIRVATGSAMAVWGYTEVTTSGYVIGTIGAVMMLGGIYNFCVVALLFGGPLFGPETSWQEKHS